MKTKYIRLFESWSPSWAEDTELVNLVLEFVFDDGGEGLWFQDTQRIISLALAHPDLIAKSIEWVERSGGKIWRGLKDNRNDTTYETSDHYEVGGYKKIDSFTVNKQTAMEFAAQGTAFLVEADLAEVRNNIVLAVPILLANVELPDWIGENLEEWWQTDDWRTEAREFIEKQAEVLVRGPLRLPIEPANPGMAERIALIKPMLQGLGQVHHSEPGSITLFTNNVELHVYSIDKIPSYLLDYRQIQQKEIIAIETQMAIKNNDQVTMIDLTGTSPQEWARRVVKEVTQ